MGKRHWYAVWFADYPDEGSLHFRAETKRKAIARARQHPWFAHDFGDDPPELMAALVTTEEHKDWEASG